MDSDLSYIITGNEQEFNSKFDKLLASIFEGLSRSQAKKMVMDGKVFVNNEPCTNAKYKVNTNDELKIFKSVAKSSNILPFEFELDIVFEDEYLAVINKPAGITVHPGAGTKDDTLVNVLAYKFGSSLSSFNDERPGIVHRLDRDTSGLMLIAKNNDIHNKLSNMIASRAVKRFYKALCFGAIKPHFGKIETCYGRSKRNPKTFTVKRDGGKIAVTNYKSLHVFGEDAISLMELQLQTGRTHQIRVHMDYIKCPIIGDKTYGAGKNHALKGIDKTVIPLINNFHRQALHAYKIEFRHPKSGEILRFEVKFPKDIQSLINEISE